jgi:hypothetical protein
MFTHQKLARDTLGFRDYTERRQRVLVAYLREQAQHRETVDELVIEETSRSAVANFACR